MQNNDLVVGKVCFDKNYILSPNIKEDLMNITSQTNEKQNKQIEKINDDNFINQLLDSIAYINDNNLYKLLCTVYSEYNKRLLKENEL